MLKQGIRRTPGDTVQEKLSKFLFNYRVMPRSVTGVSPCELLMNPKLRSRLGLLHSTVAERVEKCQRKQKELRDNKRPLREFVQVYVENFTTRRPKWIPGTIVKITRPLSYVIKLQNGSTVQRHVDSIERVQAQIRVLRRCLVLS